MFWICRQSLWMETFLVVQWTCESAQPWLLQWEVVCTSSFSQRKTGEKERDRQHG